MKITFLTVCFVALSCNLSAQSKVMSVDECMRYAVKNSPQKIVQEVQNENNKITYNQAKLGFLPSIEASVGAGLGWGRSIDPSTNVYTNTSNLNNSYGVNASLPIFNGFNTFNTLRDSKVRNSEGLTQEQKISDEIALSTMEYYFEALYNRGLSVLLKSQVENSKKQVYTLKVKEELGVKDLSEVAQAEAQLAADEVAYIQSKNKFEASLLRLKQNMFYPINDTLLIDTTNLWVGNLIEETPDAKDVFEVSKSFLPELHLSKLSIDLAKIQRHSMFWSMFPRLTTSGGFSTGYSMILGKQGGVQAPFKSEMKNRMGENFSVSLSIPIFNRLSSQSKYRKSRNEVRIAEIKYEEALQKVESDIKIAIQDMTGASKELEQADKRVESERISYEIINRKFEEGLLPFLDLQISTNKMLVSQADRLQFALMYLVKRRVVNYYNGEPYIKDLP